MNEPLTLARFAVICCQIKLYKEFMVWNLFVVYRMEPGQTGEGEVPQKFLFCASIEERDNIPTMYQV
jgi:hypothetical protein